MDPSDLDRKDVRRPMNAFLIFCKRHRSIVREKNPNLDNRSVTRILGDLWANLGDDEKSQYTDLAKQYKDAFMKANPDYKWHNPERVVPPASNKPNTRPTNVRVLKSENDLNIEGQITPGKLADPSNMGGLSLLLDSSRYSMTSTFNYKVGDKQILEVDSSSSKVETETSVDLTNTCILDKSDLTTDNVEMKMSLPNKDKEEYEENKQTSSTTTTITTTVEVKRDEDRDENGNRFKENETENHGNKADEGPLSLDQTKGGNKEVQLVNQDNKEQNKKNSVSSSSSGVTEKDPIVGCGQHVMDHIIERLFTLEKQQLDRAKDVKMEEIESSFTCIDEVDGITNIAEKTTGMSEKIEKSKNSIQICEENMIMKLPLTPQKSTEKNESSETRKRKRCFSESNVDMYESVKPIIKREKQDNEEEFHQSQNSEVDGCSQSDEFLEQTESTSQDVEKTTDHDSADEDSHPIRKSKRRNRGQRYQELINEGIIQPSRERLASMKGDNIVKEESTTEDSAICNKYDELAHDVLSVYPRQIRKRTVSESEKSKPTVDDLKRYKTGDFDLEAHIATLPACSLEKVARNAKRSIIKVRSHSDSCKKSDSDKSDVILALPVPPHLKLKTSNETGPPPTGSQKRKARKHSVTRLIPVSTTAGISLVAVKTDNQDEDVHVDNSNEKDTISKGLLNSENTSSNDGDCCHGNSNNLEKMTKMDFSDEVVQKDLNGSSDNESSCENSEAQVVIVTDSSKSDLQQKSIEINNDRVKIPHGSKSTKTENCVSEDQSVCDKKGDHVLKLKPSVLETGESGIEVATYLSKSSDEKLSSDNWYQGNDNDLKENEVTDNTNVSSCFDSYLEVKCKTLQQEESEKRDKTNKSANVHFNKPSEDFSHGSTLGTSVEGKDEPASQQSISVLDKNQISSPTLTTCDKESDMSVSMSCDSTDKKESDMSISRSCDSTDNKESDMSVSTSCDSTDLGFNTSISPSIAVQSS